MKERRPWWFAYGKCHGRLHIFISPGPNTKLCKKICDSCPALDPCFWYAMEREHAHDEARPLRFGIFGGFSAKEREKFATRYGVTQEIAQREYQRADTELMNWITDETIMG